MKSRLLRSLGVALLLLAVSPVTAPFSTCDLGQLLGHLPTPGTTSVHPKAAADEPVAWVSAAAAPQFESRCVAAYADGADGGLQIRTALHLPLRI